ncbi:MAG: 2-oxoacid:acceptor oxidoreductase family protein, partial [Acidobacteria bacterium]|nr:2-oxoacid:acceptor oxidoreductase family protein [Acidobacteriota bacterium]
LEEIPRALRIEGERDPAPPAPTEPLDFRITVAGFGGQGVLLLGEVLAEAGRAAGLEVSWLPSYGPEMRSGTSHCHVRLATTPIDSPLVSRPNVLLALNEPSLRKFLPTVAPGGWVFSNGATLPEDCRRDDVRFMVRPFTELADEIGEPRVANMVMLGALLGATGVLSEDMVTTALAGRVKSERWLEMDRRALWCGREAVWTGGSHGH